MTYRSKIDWWVALILLGVSLMDFGIGGFMLYEAVVQAAPVPFGEALVAVPVLAFFIRC